ncbi:MAG: hypothetical protein HY696_12110 [Deltaproteobacteria bacterium]|nr:hypothetical protein [Deltaproteobacteria bacterium]
MRPARLPSALFLLSLTAWCSACAQLTGNVTIINQLDQPMAGRIGKEAFHCEPKRSWSSQHVKPGEQELAITGQPAMKVTVAEGKSTIVEPSGTACFIVADYRRQYGERSTGEVQIVERFEQQKTFAPKQPLTVAYGERLPTEVPEGTPVRRLQLVDCPALHNDEQLAETLKRLP